jgi:hypothetical protein
MLHNLVGRFSAETLARQYNLDMAPVRQYLATLEKHVLLVEDFGRLLRVPEAQLAIHDESKWSAAEFPAYVRKYALNIDDKPDFERAFLHHLHHNPHHWQAYLIPSASPTPTTVEMPEPYIREMVADWLAAGAAYQPDQNPQDWLNANAARMLFHPATVQSLRFIVREAGMQWPL